MADNDTDTLDELTDVDGLEGLELVEDDSEVEEESGLDDPTWGEVVQEVDLDNDGYADVTTYDTDGDGQGDYTEGDLDNDGYNDIEMTDTDGDGRADEVEGVENWELLSDSSEHDLDSIKDDGVDLDSDRDGLTNIEEVDMVGSDYLSQDSDGDLVGDGDEVVQGSDPNDIDSYSDAGVVAQEAEDELEHEVDMAADELDNELDEYDDGGCDTYDDGGLDDTSYDDTSYDVDTSYDDGSSY